jgi:hypothetical protein
LQITDPLISETAIDEICSLNWSDLDRTGLTGVAWAYYFFSIQFRENLEMACALYPNDKLLERLAREECATDNLSPWPGVADPGEAMNHDEFMRRLLALSPIPPEMRRRVEEAGRFYLTNVRRIDLVARAASIASYEDGGLERVFRAILQSREWGTPLLQAFRHFLVMHIAFDSSPEEGHGALSRHLKADDSVEYLWEQFKQLLSSVPQLTDRISIAGNKQVEECVAASLSP